MFLKTIKKRRLRIFPITLFTNNNLYLFTGLLLLALYFTQLNMNLKWMWLENIQKDNVYRQTTGFLLLAYVYLQGRLGFQRLSKKKKTTRVLLVKHKFYGVFGPILFYLHSTDLGFAYQVMLSLVFLGNSLVGYINPQVLKVKRKGYILSWTMLHISLAILTLILMSFHIYIVYYYS